MGNNCSNPHHSKRHKRHSSSTISKPVVLSEMSQPGAREASIGIYFIKQTSTKNILRIQKQWTRLLSHFEGSSSVFRSCLHSPKYHGKFLKLIRRGPPVQYRWESWKAIAKISEKIDVSSYKDLPNGSFYTMAAIYRDLHRTFPTEPYFDLAHFGQIGQATLERILGKLAGKYLDIGYCQSMNFLGGFLLLVNGGSEVEAFYMLETILNEYQLKGFYTEDMNYLKRTIWVFERIFKKRHPKLALHFEEINFGFEMWALQWFMTLFTTTLHFNIVARIWDLFLVDRITILYQVALAIISRHETRLLEMDCLDISQFFKRLKDFIHSPESLINEALKIDISYLEVKEMERQHEQSTSIEAPKNCETLKSQESIDEIQQIVDDFSLLDIKNDRKAEKQRIKKLFDSSKKHCFFEETVHYTEEMSMINVNMILEELENKEVELGSYLRLINKHW